MLKDLNLSYAPNFQDVPKMFDNFEILEEVEQGCFGLVVKARNIYTNQIYGCKFISRLRCLEDPKFFNSISKEVRIQKNLNHPNLLKLYEIIKLEKFFVLILEWCEKQDLYEYLCNRYNQMNDYTNKEGRYLSKKEVIKLSIEIGEGIKYLHERDIGHCDLKLENILINKEDKIKIGDFGSVVETSKEIYPSSYTLLFSPPEIERINNQNQNQNQNQNYNNIKDKYDKYDKYSKDSKYCKYEYQAKEADIWSFGMIVLTIWKGDYIFEEEESWEDKIEKIENTFKYMPKEIRKIMK